MTTTPDTRANTDTKTNTRARASDREAVPLILASSSPRRRELLEAAQVAFEIVRPDVDESSETFAMFIANVARDMTQKTGQKCTAVRRVFVPVERVDAVREALVAALGAVADETGATVNQVILAWMLQHDQSVLPVFSASTPEQMRENLGAVDVSLDGEQMARLNDASAIVDG